MQAVQHHQGQRKEQLKGLRELAWQLAEDSVKAQHTAQVDREAASLAITELRRICTKLRVDLQGKEQQLTASKGRGQQQAQRIAELQAQLPAQLHEQQLAAAQSEAQQQAQRVQELLAAQASQSEQLAAQASEAEQLAARIRELEEQVAAQAGQLQQRDAAVSQLQAQAAGQSATIASLQQQAGRADELEQQLAAAERRAGQSEAMLAEIRGVFDRAAGGYAARTACTLIMLSPAQSKNLNWVACPRYALSARCVRHSALHCFACGCRCQHVRQCCVATYDKM